MKKKIKDLTFEESIKCGIVSEIVINEHYTSFPDNEDWEEIKNKEIDL